MVENREQSNKIKKLTEQIKNGQVAYEDLTQAQQIDIYQTLLSATNRPPEAILLKASQDRKHDFSHMRGDINCPMDKNVYKVKPGQYVVATYERSSAGWSRAQAGFVSEVIEDSLLDPTITIARLPDGLTDEEVKGKNREELKAILLDHILSGGKIEDIGIDEKHRLIEEMKAQGYSQITLVGEVKEPPSFANDGGLMIRGKDGEKDLDIDMSNVRELHIVGINIPRVKGINPENN